MAIVNVKSALVTNYDAQPRVLSNDYEAGGRVEEAVGIVALAAADNNTSTYRVGFIPSGVRVSDIEIMNDAMANGTSYKFGVYSNTADGGAVPVANSDLIFASVISVVAARSVWTSILFPSILNAGGLPANARLRVWELLGLTADPFKLYHLVITAVAAATVAGNIAVKYSWVR